MYKHLHNLAAFVAVAETGAFKKAAEKLGLSPSVVSHHVSNLEEHLGATLIYRTTRKLSLTEQGRDLFDVAQKLMQETEDTCGHIMSVGQRISGSLRIAAPAYVPAPDVERDIWEFACQHRDVKLYMSFSDGRVDLVDDDFDICIRLGKLPTSSLSKRKLAEVEHVLVAAPSILLDHGPPQSPQDLQQLPYIAMVSKLTRLTLSTADTTQDVSCTNPQIIVNNITGAYSAALGGLGYANLPLSICQKAIADGKLVQLLPHWHQPKLAVHAVWHNKARKNNLSARFIEFIHAALARQPAK